MCLREVELKKRVSILKEILEHSKKKALERGALTEEGSSGSANHLVIVYFQTDDEEAAKAAGAILYEGRKVQQLSKGWSIAWDGPHVDNGQHHAHILLRGNEVYAVNADGTARHNSTGKRIHKTPYKEIVKKWPNVKRIIESDDEELTDLVLPASIISEALASVQT